jgi:rhodanese-related sulfurtransferase
MTETAPTPGIRSRTGHRMSFRRFFHTPVGEAILIAAVAVLFGFGYTAMEGSGLFRHEPPSPLPGPVATSTFLSFDEAREMHSRQMALFIDSRHAYDFGSGHITGAVSVPLHDFALSHPVISALRRDQLIITYCDGEECSSSIELAKLLYGGGFTNVKVFFGGWNEWQTHNQPTEP